MTADDLAAPAILAAYRATGLRPTRGEWADASLRSCCPLMALRSWRFGLPPRRYSCSEQVAEDLGLPEGFVSGFVVGFDRKRLKTDSASARDGHALGVATAAALADAGLLPLPTVLEPGPDDLP